MIRLFLILVAISMIALPILASADKVVRDRYGSLVETWHERNGSIEIRDRNGTLKETRTNRNGTVDIRDRNGTLIGTEKYDRSRR